MIFWIPLIFLFPSVLPIARCNVGRRSLDIVLRATAMGRNDSGQKADRDLGHYAKNTLMFL